MNAQQKTNEYDTESVAATHASNYANMAQQACFIKIPMPVVEVLANHSLSARAWLLYQVLIFQASLQSARRGGKRPYTWDGSVSLLGRVAGLSKSVTNKAARDLVKHGLMSKEKHFNGQRFTLTINDEDYAEYGNRYPRAGLTALPAHKECDSRTQQQPTPLLHAVSSEVKLQATVVENYLSLKLAQRMGEDHRAELARIEAQYDKQTLELCEEFNSLKCRQHMWNQKEEARYNTIQQLIPWFAKARQETLPKHPAPCPDVDAQATKQKTSMPAVENKNKDTPLARTAIGRAVRDIYDSATPPSMAPIELARQFMYQLTDGSSAHIRPLAAIGGMKSLCTSGTFRTPWGYGKSEAIAGLTESDFELAQA